LKKYPSQKRTGGVAQGVSPEVQTPIPKKKKKRHKQSTELEKPAGLDLSRIQTMCLHQNSLFLLFSSDF
jgi:hypothetical protein